MRSALPALLSEWRASDGWKSCSVYIVGASATKSELIITQCILHDVFSLYSSQRNTRRHLE